MNHLVLKNEYLSQIPTDSTFTSYFNIFNPLSNLYTNAESEFGITVGFLKFLTHGIGVTFLCFLGAIGNGLSILVLSSSRMGNSSTTYFLRCLAVCDTIVIIGSGLFLAVPTFLVFNPEAYNEHNATWLVFNELIVRYTNFVSTVFVVQTTIMFFIGSAFFTVAITVDRYLAICKPFVARKHDLSSWEKARKVAIVLFICAIVCNLPRYWEQEYLPVVTEFNNLTLYVPVPSNLRKNYYYDALYSHMFYIVFVFVTPLLFLAIFNIIIYKEICQSRRLRKSSFSTSSTNHPDFSLTYMLFGIVIVYFMCQIIPAAGATYKCITSDVETDAYSPDLEFLICFCVAFNSSVNFLIYCLSGSKFRNALREVIKFDYKALRLL